MTQDMEGGPIDPARKFFDDLDSSSGFDEVRKYREKEAADRQHYEDMIYALFNTEIGEKVLQAWSEPLVLLPAADVGMDQLTIGLAEGERNFVRKILKIIKKVEGE